MCRMVSVRTSAPAGSAIPTAKAAKAAAFRKNDCINRYCSYHGGRMKPILLCLAAACLAAAQPLPVVFDTDMGNDVDDALALALLHSLESRGECRLVAVTVTKDNPWSAPFVDLVNT